VSRRPRLLFISPHFLFPADSGGRIRTTQILRGLKGGAFKITLVSPAEPHAAESFRRQLDEICDVFRSWPAEPRLRTRSVRRAFRLFSDLPVSVVDEWSDAGRKAVETELKRGHDLVVLDFPHTSVLVRQRLETPSLLFTHNVECEIYQRHAEVSSSPFMRRIWMDQQRKMRAFERHTLPRFDWVVAVSERDAVFFQREFGVRNVTVIPTGVDLDYFQYSPPPQSWCVAFSGGLDWAPNVDGITFLMEEVWPLVLREVPQASMKVVGRAPPDRLVKRAKSKGLDWQFTGFVDDVRPHLRQGAVYAVPLRIGGGTRIKIFEAMALGCPIVSTGIGVEGLPVEANKHYLLAESAPEFAAALVKLLVDPDLGLELAGRARRTVEESFSFRKAARVFEEACTAAIAVPPQRQRA